MSSIATFGMGCFWQPDARFAAMRGVSNVRVGYTGGVSMNPTFVQLADHCEAVEVTFNTWLVSYEQLLESFWEHHNPTLTQKRQFRSVIFYHTPEQNEQAKASLEAKKSDYELPIQTTIEFAGTFYEAEEYHQHYLKKNKVKIEV